MQSNQNSSNSHLVFSKDFISINPNSSIITNLLLQRKLQKPQRSHIAIRKMLNNLGNNKNKCKQEGDELSLRRSTTSDSKRKEQKEPTINSEYRAILRTIHRKPVEGERSKTVSKCTRIESDFKMQELNNRFKQRRENSLKTMINNSLNQTIRHGKSSHLASNYQSNDHSKGKTPTVPLKQKHKSSGHFGKFVRNSRFQVTESSQILLSNLLNPQPDQKQMRKDSCDSAKRFYLKLKKNKLGNLWKPFEQQLSLLEGQNVSKEIPSQLGICKIKLPKRNYRHEFIQNIQKIKENYLRIKGSAQKAKVRNIESPSKSFQRSAFKPKRIEKKMYQINYRRPTEEGHLTRSKTEFFQSRSQWQTFVNIPFEPWDTQQESNKIIIR